MRGGSHLTASASEQEAAAPLPAGTLAGSSQDSQDEATSADGGAVAPDDGQALEADLQSADAAAADGGSGGTTISIAVYRSSFPIEKWDLNDDDFGLTKAEWAWENRTGELPKDASPGSEVSWPESGKPADYAEPTRAGFEFAGWSTDESASAGGFLSASPAITMPEGAPESKSYTLYALWTPLEYSVIFDLAKNPEDGNGPGSDASYALNWESDSGVNRTVTNLGGGRFRVDGFTMDERTYDAATRTVGLPEPSRTGYRFLGWAEPDGQRLAIDNAARDGYALNPVRLTQLDGTPVLTARWASAFGVTAPLSVTFGDYDKTGAPGNPWLGDKNSNAADDTTQSEADDTTKDEQSGYEALGQAYFENTSWHEAVKVVGLSSERHASANQVLTTYDSKQASEAAVLGDGTEANPGERLLSLYPSASAPADKSSGVHFRLSDSLDETTLGSSFTMGAQGSGSEKLPITYGLNLSTDPVDNSANHGLVLPTNDYERKQIATISYTFATGATTAVDPYTHCTATGTVDDAIYIEHDGKVYGTADILHAANCISNYGTESPCYALYDRIMRDQGVPSAGLLPADAKAKVYARYTGAEATASQPNCKRAGYVRLLIVGLNHDAVELTVEASAAYDGTKNSSQMGRRAGLTFQFMDALFDGFPMNHAGETTAGGWRESDMRTSTLASGGSIASHMAIYPSVKGVYKFSNKVGGGDAGVGGSTADHRDVIGVTYDRLFLPSSTELSGYWISTPMQDHWFHYEGFQYAYWKDVCGVVGAASGQSTGWDALIKANGSGTATPWWLRLTRIAPNCYANVTSALDSLNQGWSFTDHRTALAIAPCFCL